MVLVSYIFNFVVYFYYDIYYFWERGNVFGVFF